MAVLFTIPFSHRSFLCSELHCGDEEGDPSISALNFVTFLAPSLFDLFYAPKTTGGFKRDGSSLSEAGYRRKESIQQEGPIDRAKMRVWT